ncbi:MAG: MFS transporter, partial [Alphaproteobacteria bacterium]
GYVTEVHSWPWIFHFNVPIGAVVFLGLAAFVPAASRDRARRMDWYGFTALALGLAAIQLVLNRGQRQDWLASSEIVIELALAGFCLYVFVVHSLTTRTPFIDRALFRDRNVVLGFGLVFAWGLMLHSPLVLLSLRLQGLGNYPVLETGILMAPRGVGGIVAMLVVGWLITRVSPKHLFVLGILCIAFASWIMSGWPIEAVDREVIFTAFLFGFGVALAWVPLSILTFSTIDSRYRTEGVTFFNLLLNMGLGVGITIAIIVFSQGAQINHEWLANFATPYNELFHDAHVPRQWSLDGPRGLSAFDAEVQRQAKTIAFNNAFRLIMLTALAVAPLIYFLSGPAARRRPLAARAAAD